MELAKDSLHRNCNFMNNEGESQVNGGTFLKKVLNHTKADGSYSVDLVGALHKFEERFLSESDKELLLLIL